MDKKPSLGKYPSFSTFNLFLVLMIQLFQEAFCHLENHFQSSKLPHIKGTFFPDKRLFKKVLLLEDHQLEKQIVFDKNKEEGLKNLLRKKERKIYRFSWKISLNNKITPPIKLQHTCFKE